MAETTSAALRAKISDSQSSRLKFLHQKHNEIVAMNSDSMSTAFFWTGRSDVEQSHFVCYGEQWQNWPPHLVGLLKQLIYRCARHFHPGWKSKPGDSDAVTLLESIGGSGCHLDDDNSLDFFNWLEEQHIIGRGAALQLKQGWLEYRPKLQAKKGKENVRPSRPPQTSALPMQATMPTMHVMKTVSPLLEAETAPPIQATAAASPMMEAATAPPVPATVGAPPMLATEAAQPMQATGDWQDLLDSTDQCALTDLLLPMTGEFDGDKPGKRAHEGRRRPHTNAPGRFHQGILFLACFDILMHLLMHILPPTIIFYVEIGEFEDEDYSPEPKRRKPEGEDGRGRPKGVVLRPITFVC